MKKKFQIPALFLACGALIFSSGDAFAQGKGNGQNKQKEYKVKEKDYKDKEYKDKDYKVGQTSVEAKKGKPAKAYKSNNGKGNAKGRKFAHATPHNVKVPPGHYPPAGHYRIWYPGRPPGQQPAPVRNGMPVNAPLTDGAFILYGDRAYDTQYDWRQAEVQQKKSIPREVIDILFPSSTVGPAQ